MTWIVFLLGAILFLPGYLFSLERTLEQGQPFRPLRVALNIRTIDGRVKRLTYFGFCLACVALFATALGYGDMALISEDFVRVILAIMCIYFVLAYGYIKSELGLKEASISVEALKKRSSTVLLCLVKSTKDLSLILLVFIIVFLSNQLSRDGAKWLPL